MPTRIWTREEASAAGKKGQETQRRHKELVSLVRATIKDLAQNFPLELSTRIRANLIQTTTLLEQESARGLKADPKRMLLLGQVLEQLKKTDALDLEPGRAKVKTREPAPSIPTPAPQPGPSPAAPSTPSPIESAPID